VNIEAVVRQNLLGRVRDRLFPASARRIDRVKARIRDEAKLRAPVRTGYLRDSIAVTADGVVVAAPYARYPEFGTRYMAARPYLRPAVQRVEAELGGFWAGFEVEVVA